MVRPVKDRIVSFHPEVSYLKPRGIPMVDLTEIRLTVDEREALRLADLEGLSHEQGGACMGVSRATFGRIITHARTVVADALINGKAIKVEGGNYKFVDSPRMFECRQCQHRWEEPPATGRPAGCPACRENNFERLTTSP